MMNETTSTTPAARLEALPDVLLPMEAAKVLRMGRNATYEALRVGKIPSVRIGRKILVPKEAVARMLAAAEGKGAVSG